MARWRTGGGVYVSSLDQRGLVGVIELTDSVTLDEPVTSLRGSRQSIGLSAARQTPKVQSSCRVSRRFQNVKHVQVRKDLHLVTLYSYFRVLCGEPSRMICEPPPLRKKAAGTPSIVERR